MAYDLTRRFVIAVSSRALFDLSRENHVFETAGQQEYDKMQREQIDSPATPGSGFRLVRSMLGLNDYLPPDRGIETVLLSRNSVQAGKRIVRSLRHHKLAVSRSAFTTGESVVPYLGCYSVDLFLSANPEDVAAAAGSGVPAALVMGNPYKHPREPKREIRIAFDGDSVLFGSESEAIYQSDGMDAFHKNEYRLKDTPMTKGPMARLLFSLRYLQRILPSGAPAIRVAIVTARNGPADERVMTTLDSWGVEVDQMFFLGGMDKWPVLREFNPDIFFDDQLNHCSLASGYIPSAQVPSNLFTLFGSESPLCPKCGGKTVRREARRGPTKGKPFFGCARFPACRGSVSVA